MAGGVAGGMADGVAGRVASELSLFPHGKLEQEKLPPLTNTIILLSCDVNKVCAVKILFQRKHYLPKALRRSDLHAFTHRCWKPSL